MSITQGETPYRDLATSRLSVSAATVVLHAISTLGVKGETDAARRYSDAISFPDKSNHGVARKA